MALENLDKIRFNSIIEETAKKLEKVISDCSFLSDLFKPVELIEKREINKSEKGSGMQSYEYSYRGLYLTKEGIVEGKGDGHKQECNKPEYTHDYQKSKEKILIKSNDYKRIVIEYSITNDDVRGLRAKLSEWSI